MGLGGKGCSYDTITKVMDKEYFCNKYCPCPTLYYDPTKPDDKLADCDLEESECPFKDVDFNKVVGQIGSRAFYELDEVQDE